MSSADTGLAESKYPIIGGMFIDNSEQYIISSIAIYVDSRYAEIGISRGVPYTESERTVGKKTKTVRRRTNIDRLTCDDLKIAWRSAMQALSIEFDKMITLHKRSRSWFERRHGFNYIEMYSGYYVTVSRDDKILSDVFIAHDDYQKWIMYTSGYVRLIERALGGYKRLDYSKQELQRLKGVALVLATFKNVKDPRFAFAIYSKVKKGKPLLDLIIDTFPKTFAWSYDQMLAAETDWEKLLKIVKDFPLPIPFVLRTLPKKDEIRKKHAANCIRLEFLQMRRRGSYKDREEQLPVYSSFYETIGD